MAPDAVLTELTACVRAGVVRSAKRSRIVRKINSLVLIVIFSLLFPRHGGIAAIIGWFSCLCLVNLFAEQHLLEIGFSLWGHRSGRAERDAVRRLAAQDDVRSVGDLIDALNWMNDKGTQESAVRPELSQAPARLLPRLTEEQVQQLGKQRHGCMARWMKLWEKMALSHSGEQLLRASAPTPTAPGNLLRPAGSGQHTEPQELLRPDPSRLAPEDNSASG